MMVSLLVLDLSPNLSYPDLSIAYLVTPLRAAGFQVDVKKLATHPPENQPLQHRAKLFELNLANIEKYLKHSKPALILVPNYSNHYATIHDLAQSAQALQLPLLLGGACLDTCNSENLPLWLNLQGVTAVFVGEADWVIVEVVDTILSKQDLSVWPGIHQHGVELEHSRAPALQELERLPIPDLSDFAWQSTSSALISVLTGRMAMLDNNQRVYSSRPVQAVLDELKIQAQTYQHKTFIFLDASLNTNLAMWHGLIDNIQTIVPGCQWMATIYLDGKNTLGLDLNTLVAARAAGLHHLDISLDAAQSLKQGRLLNTTMERNRALVAQAYQAGLSVRCLVHNDNSFNNLADLPNTHEFLLRKLIETEQAKHLPKQTLPKNKTPPDSALLNKASSELKTNRSELAAMTTAKPSIAELATKSFWQRFKANLAINKTNKTAKVKQLV